MSFKIGLALLLLAKLSSQTSGNDPIHLLKALDSVASLEQKYLAVYRKMLEHKNNRLAGTLALTDSEK